MERPQIGSKYICTQDDDRGFTKGKTYTVAGFDVDDDVLFENHHGMQVFFTWREKHRKTSMYLPKVFKPWKIYLGGE